MKSEFTLSSTTVARWPALLGVCALLVAESGLGHLAMSMALPTSGYRLMVLLVLGWLGLLLAFLAWAVYRYTAQPANPYRNQTLGLPPGTVRASLAYTLLLAGLALMILGLDPGLSEHPGYGRQLQAQGEFVQTAFLMMIAFYFGSQSLRYLVRRRRHSSVGYLDMDTGRLPQGLPEPVEGEDPGSFQPISLSGRKPRLTPAAIAEAARTFGLEPALVRAVMAVESAGRGFFSDGRPVIRFEGHVFYRLVQKRHPARVEAWAAAHPHILHRRWTRRHYRRDAAEYEHLDAARALDPAAAQMATSWGLFQILGLHFRRAGFATVAAFVQAQGESEQAQLAAFLTFLNRTGLSRLLQRHDWPAFARAYNGPAYRRNRYHLKLERAYRAALATQAPSRQMAA